ncbi:hypothetical protein LHYA1_G000630 [Lachnellula hyalina]|uniref:37S ribosomal protein YMR-31, mitochondrial n=1 Tax=Lachnellula hyalina TaxID=1316788 RepID=A0A8H8U407_9HELO|nr:uncharacterized protein LHYA1_G000630 [Lachnellula hyalina]TVY30594.1 hypothetical protein LHYA1_G000630 [Lachnellula hyalina]
MFATKALRQASAAAERTPLIKFIGKRSIPSSVDHTPHAHPASPSHELPADFSKNSSPSFSSYRQKAQQHGPLGRSSSSEGSIGAQSGHSLGSVAPAKGEFFDRSELPARFRRTPIDLSEIDAIETGGATLVC